MLTVLLEMIVLLEYIDLLFIQGCKKVVRLRRACDALFWLREPNI